MQLRSRSTAVTSQPSAAAHVSDAVPVGTKRKTNSVDKNGASVTGLKKRNKLVDACTSKDVLSSGRGLDRSSEAAYLARHRYVIGVDEAGRGPLAGPVVAAACIIDTHKSFMEGIDIMDSKVTTEAGREATFGALAQCSDVYFSTCRVEHDEIDRLNILQASMAAMTRAVRSLLDGHAHIDPRDCIVLVDGNRIPEDLPAAAEFVIKGDSKIYSIAAASIIAKITRDRIMQALHEQFPLYNLARHKGYPTLEHRQLLMQHGPSSIHRYSYRPVAEAAVKHNIAFSVPTKEARANALAKSAVDIKAGVQKRARGKRIK